MRDFIKILHRQKRFSVRAFGPGPRAAGCIDHIRKELAEVEKAPTDLEEWIDIAMLAFDGAWRAGFTAEQVAAAYVAKLEKNERRDWPDWRTADPDKAIEHVRDEAPAKVEGDWFWLADDPDFCGYTPDEAIRHYLNGEKAQHQVLELGAALNLPGFYVAVTPAGDGGDFAATQHKTREAAEAALGGAHG